jgi:hypothetical protein
MSSEAETDNSSMILRAAYRRQVFAWACLLLVFVYLLLAGPAAPLFCALVLMFIGLRLSMLIVIYGTLPAAGAATEEGSDGQQSMAALIRQAKHLRLLPLWYLLPFVVALIMPLAARGPSLKVSLIVPTVAVVVVSVWGAASGLRAASQLKCGDENMRMQVLWLVVGCVVLLVAVPVVVYLSHSRLHDTRDWPVLSLPDWARDIHVNLMETVPESKLVLWHESMAPFLSITFSANRGSVDEVHRLLVSHLEAQGYSYQRSFDSRTAVFRKGDFRVKAVFIEKKGTVEISIQQTTEDHLRLDS